MAAKNHHFSFPEIKAWRAPHFICTAQSEEVSTSYVECSIAEEAWFRLAVTRPKIKARLYIAKTTHRTALE
jgi:uncharacterized protein (DUF736 family)